MALRRATIRAAAVSVIFFFTIQTGSACSAAPTLGSLTRSITAGSTTIATGTTSKKKEMAMAIREETLFPDSLTEQRPMGAPIVNAPGLPLMEAVGKVKTVLRNSLLSTMGTDFAAALTGENLMTEQVEAMSETPPWPGEGPQRPKPDQAASSSTEGYIRVEIHAANGQLSVIGASEVPGPLTIPSAVINGLAYKVLVDDQQIALGSIPD